MTPVDYTPAAADALKWAFAGVVVRDPKTFTAAQANRADGRYFGKPVQDELLALWKATLADPSFCRSYTCLSGLAVGDPVYISAANTATKADATTEAKSRVLGFVCYKPTTTSCYIVPFCYKSSLSGLTAGAWVYLSDSGTVTATAGTVAKIIGLAISTTEAICFTHGSPPLASNSVALASLANASAQGKLIGRKTASGGSWEEVAPDGATLELPVGGSLQIKDAGVSYAKIQNISAQGRLLGRKTAAAGATEEISPDGATLELPVGGSLGVKDGGVTFAKQVQAARPVQNLLINGGFDIDQRGAGASRTLADASYSFDRWILLGKESGASYRAAVVRVDAAAESAQYACQVTSSGSGAGNQRSGLVQIIEAGNVIPLRGRTVRFQARIASVSGTHNFRAAILEWTGTADTSIVRDVVNDWTSTTYTKNNFFSNDAGIATITAANVSAQTAVGTSYADLALEYAVSANANNLIIFIWQQDDEGIQWKVTKAGLYDGTAVRDWLPRPIAQELTLCQRYCCRLAANAANTTLMFAYGSAVGTTAAQPLLRFPVSMRVVPTLTTVGTFGLTDSVGGSNCDPPAIISGCSSVDSVWLTCINATGLTQYRGYWLYARSDATAALIFDAEL